MIDRVNLKSQSKSWVEFTIRLSAPAIWAAVILWLSLTSTPPDIPGPLGWDKLLHAGAYGLLAFLLAQLFRYLTSRTAKIFWPVVLATVAFGGLVEILQWAGQAGRVAEWWDLAADALGAIAGCVIFRQASNLSFNYYERKSKKHG